MLLSREEHFRDEIAGDYAAARADSFRQSQGRFTGTTSEIENGEIREESSALNDEISGGTRLESKLIEPFFPEWSGFAPFLPNHFLTSGTRSGIRRQIAPPTER
jgi:hypothetical protein